MGKTEKLWEKGVRLFPELRERCGSMEEIAKEIGCTSSYVYTHIIPKTGIPRDACLFQPHSKPVYLTKPGRKPGSKNKANVVVTNDEVAIQKNGDYSEVKPDNGEISIVEFNDIMNNTIISLKKTEKLLKELKRTLEVHT